jgi:hypothetical protein
MWGWLRGLLQPRAVTGAILDHVGYACGSSCKDSMVLGRQKVQPELTGKVCANKMHTCGFCMLIGLHFGTPAYIICFVYSLHGNECL